MDMTLPPVSPKLLERVGGDRALLAEISQLFIDGAPDYLNRISRALEARDATALRQAAHGLKGAAANFEAHDVVEGARALEDAGRTGDLTGTDDLWRTLSSDMDRLIAELRLLL